MFQVGSGEAVLGDLILSLTNRFQSEPISSVLLDKFSRDIHNNSLSEKLAKKTKKQVFLSYNINLDDPNFHQKVQDRIFEELAISPECF